MGSWFANTVEMTPTDKYCMKVDNFDTNVVNTLVEMRDSKEFFDVTLISDEEAPIQAHKVVLSSSSPFFRNVLKFNQSPSPLLYIRGLTNSDLANVVEFLYKGEITVAQNDLDKFLKVSKDLKLKGLYENDEVNNLDWTSGETPKKENIKENKKPKKPLISKKDKVTDNDLVKMDFTSEKNEDLTKNAKQPLTELDENNVKTENYCFQVIESTDEIVQDLPIDDESRDISALDEKITEMMFKENRMWQCKTCGLSKAKKSNIQVHIEINHLDIPQPCNFCDIVSKNRPALANHIKKSHTIDQ